MKNTRPKILILSASPRAMELFASTFRKSGASVTGWSRYKRKTGVQHIDDMQPDAIVVLTHPNRHDCPVISRQLTTNANTAHIPIFAIAPTVHRWAVRDCLKSGVLDQLDMRVMDQYACVNQVWKYLQAPEDYEPIAVDQQLTPIDIVREGYYYMRAPKRWIEVLLRD